MGNVRLELMSWIADIAGTNVSNGKVVLEVQSGENRTVSDILDELATKYTRFGPNVFDIKGQKLSERVIILLNGSLLLAEDGLKTVLNDGDILTILPNIEGG